MLDMQLHSCSNLAHVHDYNSDYGSFRDCVVKLSHYVQMCFILFSPFPVFLLFLYFFFFVALVAIKGI